VRIRELEARHAAGSVPDTAETVAVTAEILRESAALIVRTPSMDSSRPPVRGTPQSSS
jgi:hypothetical protein